MGVLILQLVGFILPILICVWYGANQRWSGSEEWRRNLTQNICGTLVFSIIVAAILYPVLIFSNIGTVNRLTAFYDYNADEYKVAMERLYEGVPIPEDMEMAELFFESSNLQQIESYRVAVISTRDAIVKYNNQVKHHLYWQDSWLAGALIKNLPEHVTYISTR